MTALLLPRTFGFVPILLSVQYVQSALLRARSINSTSARADSQTAWVRRSTVTGPDVADCRNYALDPGTMPECDEGSIYQFREFSNVLRSNPGGLSKLFGNAVFVGDNAAMGLQSCIVRPDNGSTRTGPLRVIVDAQYVNHPRCCDVDRLDGLATTDTGATVAWTRTAIKSVAEAHSVFKVSYRKLAPASKVCTDKHRCPLVIELPGPKDQPWLMVQAHCAHCNSKLRAVLLSVNLSEQQLDLGWGGEFAPASISDRVLRSSLVPFVQHYLKMHSELDRHRTYLLGHGAGNDVALRTALLAPHVFQMVSLAGKTAISSETAALLQNQTVLANLERSRLKSIQFHIGDADSLIDDEDYFGALVQSFAKYPVSSEMPAWDLRIYPQGQHNMWYAAWNGLHELIWTGLRKPDFGVIPWTCYGGKSSERFAFQG